jgi:hypothetical protein
MGRWGGKGHGKTETDRAWMKFLLGAHHVAVRSISIYTYNNK